MQTSNAPVKSAVPFAESGTKNAIPVASQIGVTPGAASFVDGFPPLTMTPLAAGGVPPYGADFNGILNFLSAAARWQQAGGAYPYDTAFSAAIGGYPQGAMLKQSVGRGYWLNLAENNTSNPDAGGEGWIAMPAGIATLIDANDATNDTRAVTPAGLNAFLRGRPGRLKRVRVYDTIGSELYSASSGTQAVFVEVQGGGGSGGSTLATPLGQSAVAGGGGGGGYCSSWLTSGFNGVVITVGQGGAPVAGGGASGNPGGLSSFGSLLSASGGSGGPGGPTTGPAPIVTGGGSGGGSGGGNVLNALGGQAHSSFALSNGTSLNGGAGGASHLGGGGGPTSAGNQPGNAGLTYGAGGSGCATGQNQAATNGGRGFKGAVIVWEYE
ncbi:hypothetical protein [Achromobacter anxifer]|uniref:hypothetical protein n=1 Tax=Achromobacter anxifer TaxID=1287737 RepID=UPI0021579027|nr:hypothetical protein [Achromobacter anxifer]MDF8364515.1 hypothetical protein [Achromobacter anxifer]